MIARSRNVNKCVKRSRYRNSICRDLLCVLVQVNTGNEHLWPIIGTGYCWSAIPCIAVLLEVDAAIFTVWSASFKANETDWQPFGNAEYLLSAHSYNIILSGYEGSLGSSWVQVLSPTRCMRSPCIKFHWYHYDLGHSVTTQSSKYWCHQVQLCTLHCIAQFV